MKDGEKSKYLRKSNNQKDEIVFTTKTNGKTRMEDWQLTLMAIANLLSQKKSLTNDNLLMEKSNLSTKLKI